MVDARFEGLSLREEQDDAVGLVFVLGGEMVALANCVRWAQEMRLQDRFNFSDVEAELKTFMDSDDDSIEAAFSTIRDVVKMTEEDRLRLGAEPVQSWADEVEQSGKAGRRRRRVDLGVSEPAAEKIAEAVTDVMSSGSGRSLMKEVRRERTTREEGAAIVEARAAREMSENHAIRLANIESQLVSLTDQLNRQMSILIRLEEQQAATPRPPPIVVREPLSETTPVADKPALIAPIVKSRVSRRDRQG